MLVNFIKESMEILWVALIVITSHTLKISEL